MAIRPVVVPTQAGAERAKAHASKVCLSVRKTGFWGGFVCHNRVKAKAALCVSRFILHRPVKMSVRRGELPAVQASSSMRR